MSFFVQKFLKFNVFHDFPSNLKSKLLHPNIWIRTFQMNDIFSKITLLVFIISIAKCILLMRSLCKNYQTITTIWIIFITEYIIISSKFISKLDDNVKADFIFLEKTFLCDPNFCVAIFFLSVTFIIYKKRNTNSWFNNISVEA